METENEIYIKQLQELVWYFSSIAEESRRKFIIGLVKAIAKK
ncbi:MAG: hypothetical protein ACI9CD_000066 [Candidatus Deianiraeaceae bacterium]|jgi:hypothetical protein